VRDGVWYDIAWDPLMMLVEINVCAPTGGILRAVLDSPIGIIIVPARAVGSISIIGSIGIIAVVAAVARRTRTAPIIQVHISTAGDLHRACDFTWRLLWTSCVPVEMTGVDSRSQLVNGAFCNLFDE